MEREQLEVLGRIDAGLLAAAETTRARDSVGADITVAPAMYDSVEGAASSLLVDGGDLSDPNRPAGLFRASTISNDGNVDGPKSHRYCLAPPRTTRAARVSTPDAIRARHRRVVHERGWWVVGAAVDMFRQIAGAGYSVAGFSSRAFLKIERPRGALVSAAQLGQHEEIVAQARVALGLGDTSRVVSSAGLEVPRSPSCRVRAHGAASPP